MTPRSWRSSARVTHSRGWQPDSEVQDSIASHPRRTPRSGNDSHAPCVAMRRSAAAWQRAARHSCARHWSSCEPLALAATGYTRQLRRCGGQPARTATGSRSSIRRVTRTTSGPDRTIVSAQIRATSRWASGAPQRMPRATPTMEPAAASASASAPPVPAATSVSPIRLIDPGTSSQKPGTNDA